MAMREKEWSLIAQHYTWPEVQNLFAVNGASRNLPARYCISPGMTVEVVTRSAFTGERNLMPMRWGFGKTKTNESSTNTMIRIEDIGDLEGYRIASQTRRCIVPVSGFFKKSINGNRYHPQFFTAADGFPILACAALWDVQQNTTECISIYSCAMIVSEQANWTAPYNGRMPIVLHRDYIDPWLDGRLDILRVRPITEEALRRQLSWT